MYSRIIFLLVVFFYIFTSSVSAASSFKKGAGQDWRYPMKYCNTTDINNTCVVNFMNKVKSLGVTWIYQWGLIDPRPAWLDSSIEFVPMIFAKGDGPNNSYPQDMLNWYADWAKRYPGSHWLIWNEPDWNATISPLVAASIYKPLYEAIKKGDSTAKIIVGGLAYIDFGPNSWINKFRNEYNRLYGQYPPLDGWAFHYYKDYTFDGFRNTLNGVRDWYANNGYTGKEFWLTEFGNLSSNEIGLQILKDQQEWLENESWITRYAFFYTGVEGSMKGNLLTGSLTNLGAAQLSSLGVEYAKHPVNVPNSPTPTLSSLSFSFRSLGITNSGVVKQFELLLVSGGTTKSYIFTSTSGTSGIFSESNLEITGVSPGTYTVYLKDKAGDGAVANHLRKSFGGINIVAGQNIAPLEWGTNSNYYLKPGDVNGDNRITIEDVTAILSVYTSVSTPVNSNNQKYDINGDNRINIDDVSLVLGQYIQLVISGD